MQAQPGRSAAARRQALAALKDLLADPEAEFRVRVYPSEETTSCLVPLCAFSILGAEAKPESSLHAVVQAQPGRSAAARRQALAALKDLLADPEAGCRL